MIFLRKTLFLIGIFIYILLNFLIDKNSQIINNDYDEDVDELVQQFN